MFNNQELQKVYFEKCNELFEEHKKIHHDICDLELELNKNGITTECHWVLKDHLLSWEPWKGGIFRLVCMEINVDGEEVMQPLNECTNKTKATVIKYLPDFLESMLKDLADV